MSKSVIYNGCRVYGYSDKDRTKSEFVWKIPKTVATKDIIKTAESLDSLTDNLRKIKIVGFDKYTMVYIRCMNTKTKKTVWVEENNPKRHGYIYG